MSDNRDQVVEYICERFAQEDFILNNILSRQEEGGGPMMNVGPDQGKFLNLLIKSHKAKNVLEIGSYYGYSSVWMARAIHDLNAVNGGGHKLDCVEVSAQQADIIREHFIQAGLENDTEVFEGSGIDIMEKFIKEKRAYDIVFIDADKSNYSNYMDLSTKLLRSGGLLLVDNCIWNGAVVNPGAPEKSTQAIQAFNDKLSASYDYESTIVTIQDGLAYAVKK